MSDNKIQAILDTTMDKLKAMVNADVITGEPIYVNDLTLIPVSKVAYGIATGGSDFATKSQSGLFGGGSGAGVTVSPIAFMAELTVCSAAESEISELSSIPLARPRTFISPIHANILEGELIWNKDLA